LQQLYGSTKVVVKRGSPPDLRPELGEKYVTQTEERRFLAGNQDGTSLGGLASFGGQNHHHDHVPTDNQHVKEVHDPYKSSYSHCNRDCNHLADDHTAQASELEGQARDQGVYLQRANVEGRERREQIEYLKRDERPP
jgi:hypothetical protein